MKIIMVHTYYRESGGEDQSFGAEMSCLSAEDHEVTLFVLRNQELTNMHPLRRVINTHLNRFAYKRLRLLIREVKPDIIHVQNTFPLASPAVIHAAVAESIPVIVSLRNYRLLCLNGLFFRNGLVCEDCLGKMTPYPGIVHGCWRGRLASTLVYSMILFHRLIKTWDKVNRFFVLSEFARRKMIQGGFSPNKFVVKPNFVAPDPGIGTHTGGYALFVGRLSAEKGIRTLLRAWERLGGKLPLKIVGDGPLSNMAREAVRQIAGVEWLGRKTPQEVYELMGEAECLVFPTECYETFGRVAVEAYAKGTPVIASNIGAASELVHAGRTGLLFRPGDPEDLAAKVEWLLSRPKEVAHMRKEARREYEEKYTAEINYNQLMQIYQQAIGK